MSGADETRRRLDDYLQAYPGLRGRVCRVLLLHLHSRGLANIEDIYRRAQRAEEWNRPVDPNRPATRMWAAGETEMINRLVLDIAAQVLRPEEVDELVWAAHRRDEAQSLETLARMPDVPLELLVEKVNQYASLASTQGDDGDANAPEGTRVALLRRFISDRVDYISVAKRHLRVRDMSWVLNRVVGTERGDGMVGGKAAGMLLAWAILRSAEGGPVRLPETVFVLTDAYDEFKQVNGLTHLQDHKYKSIEVVRGDYPAIREIFRNAEFPARIADLLAAALEAGGPTPLVVRSSSLLEDSFGATFSGIYKSLFLPNQGSSEERLRDLAGAIAEIYSGVFSPDALQYRRVHNLLDDDERMAVMVQRVVGARHGRYFLPAFAGVAFSRNDHRWNRRIRREDGLVRLVVGLGTHAVDRVGDYARMVPLGLPTLRPEGSTEEVLRASQRQADVVDLEDGGFRRVPVGAVLDAMRDAGIADLVSVMEEDGRLSTPLGALVQEPAARLCVTFDRLLARGDFPQRLRNLLGSLEGAYARPVEVELAVEGGDVFALQCRPLGADRGPVRVPIPADIPDKDLVFTANRDVGPGALSAIEYVVLVDPRDYGGVATVEGRLRVARAVGHVNDALAGKTFILMGPGRWGSQDVLLGVQVGYGDICNAKALIEIARASEGYAPEPSFGTHFFQDLLEAAVLYLPLYPGEPDIVFNEGFLLGGPNALARISRKDAKLADVVRVIDVAAAAPGRTLELVMDGETQRALCYLK
ncbi:MAG: PEP/pyruvate-binding domain-containing protein [Planctomycetota bacterium]